MQYVQCVDTKDFRLYVLCESAEYLQMIPYTSTDLRSLL